MCVLVAPSGGAVPSRADTLDRRSEKTGRDTSAVGGGGGADVVVSTRISVLLSV
jgi:hypothetical protein